MGKKKQTTASDRIGAILLLVILFAAFYYFGTRPTPPPAPPPTTEDLIRNEVRDVQDITINTGAIVVTYRYQALISYDIATLERQMVNLACTLRNAGHTAQNFQFAAQLPVTDAFGNESWQNGLVVRLLPDAINAINCDSFAGNINLRAIADFYQVSDLLQ